MTSSEFLHHMVLDSIDPLPDRRMDYYAARQAAMLANRWRDPKKTAPYELRDFLLFTDEETQPPTEDELEEKLRQAFG